MLNCHELGCVLLGTFIIISSCVKSSSSPINITRLLVNLKGKCAKMKNEVPVELNRVPRSQRPCSKEPRQALINFNVQAGEGFSEGTECQSERAVRH